VSGDSVKTQKAYKEHHKLPFTLLADEKGEVAKAFGVPVGKGGTIKFKDPPLEATRGVTIQRWTFVIDKDGKILYKNDKANVRDDAQKVLEAIDHAGK
jgi:peroxiredoxin Q/BCP